MQWRYKTRYPILVGEQNFWKRQLVSHLKGRGGREKTRNAILERAISEKKIINFSFWKMGHEGTRQGTPFNIIYRRAKLLENTIIFFISKGRGGRTAWDGGSSGSRWSPWGEYHEISLWIIQNISLNIIEYPFEFYRIPLLIS